MKKIHVDEVKEQIINAITNTYYRHSEAVRFVDMVEQEVIGNIGIFRGKGAIQNWFRLMTNKSIVGYMHKSPNINGDDLLSLRLNTAVTKYDQWLSIIENSFEILYDNDIDLL